MLADQPPDVQRHVRSAIDGSAPTDGDEVETVELDRANRRPSDLATAEYIQVDGEYQSLRTRADVGATFQAILIGGWRSSFPSRRRW